MNKKFLGVMAVALTLVLASCGKTGDSTGPSASSRHVHTWGEWQVVTEANCTDAGSEKRVCSVCLEEGTRTIAALGHNWGETIPTVLPGIGIPGEGTRTCLRCDITETVVIPALSPEIDIQTAVLIKNEGKVYIQISGTAKYFTNETFVWALGLKRASADDWLFGSATPTDEAYVFHGVLTPGANENDPATFTIDFNLTDIVPPSGIAKAGNWNVYAGPKGLYATFPSLELLPGNEQDGTYNYYFRSDGDVGSVFSVCLDELPPYFHLQNATVEFANDGPIDEGTGEPTLRVWGVISGEASDQDQTVEELQAILDEVVPFNRFQRRAGSFAQTQTAEQMHFEVRMVEGKLMVYFYTDITFMVAAGADVYNTHLNLKSSSVSANCVMETTFSNPTVITGTGVTIEPFSNPKGAVNADNAYGNLGWRVTVAA